MKNMHDNVLARLRALQKMDAAALRTLWRDLHKAEPPKNSCAPYLIKRLSYRIQELARGGDSAETKARLAHLAKLYCAGKHDKKPVLTPGTILTRIYRGVEYQVATLADGFQYDGCKFGSLSAIAKLITGMSWNGLEFFGLKKRSSKVLS